MMEYKAYLGRVKYDNEAEIFHGEVINTRDVITFQGDSVKELKQAFIESIEDYLDFCRERGESPERPFSGRFNLRLDPETHRDAYIAAQKAGVSLNTWVTNAITHHNGIRD